MIRPFENPRWNRRQTRRSGFAMVQALLLLLIVGSLLSLSATLLRRAFMVHTQAVESLNRLQRLQLASERFRADAQGSISARVADSLELDRGAYRLVYRLVNGHLLREKFLQDKLLATEAWELPGEAAIRWQLDKDGNIPLVTCRLEFLDAGSPSGMDLLPLQWSARVGVVNLTQPGQIDSEIDAEIETRGPSGEDS